MGGPLDFGNVILGEVATRRLTIRNTGTTELLVSGVTLPPAFATDWLAWRDGKVAPSGEVTVTIYFVPVAPIPYSGSVTVAADHTGGTNTLAVTGTGVFTPGPTGDRIPDAEVVQNIIVQNQDSTAGGKQVGAISRWELPLPVYLAPGIDRDHAIRALDYLQANAGISYVLVSDNADPLVTVTSGQLGGNAGATGGIFSVFGNNRARVGRIVIGSNNVPCRWDADGCMNMYRHELFHVLGIFGHLSYPPQPPYVPAGAYPFKELAMLRSLYALPHGAKVTPDGTWR